jgi:hypothetical protein
MAKTTAPMLSFGARGQIGKAMVASSWRGVKYMRQHVIPANPRTTAQQTVRTTFALLREMWKLAPTLVKAPWDAFAKGRPFTGMNKFVGENVRVLNGELTMDNFIGSPGAGGGLPPDDVVLATPGAGDITATFTVPAAPDGWALAAAVAFAFKDQDPSAFFEGVFTAAEDVAGPAYVVALNDVGPAGDYKVASYLRWTKPDGALAYSVSLLGEIAVA